jgi:hypothetical protein
MFKEQKDKPSCSPIAQSRIGSGSPQFHYRFLNMTRSHLDKEIVSRAPHGGNQTLYTLADGTWFLLDNEQEPTQWNPAKGQYDKRYRLATDNVLATNQKKANSSA